MNKKATHHLIMTLAILLGCIGTAAGLFAPSANAASVSNVQTHGASYGEWSARWWQWLLSIPAAVNPNLDMTGENCDQGQVFSDVWFLAGTFSVGQPVEPVKRLCTIPSGKSLFFPIINIISFKPWGYETLLDLRHSAANFIDGVSVLEVTIDRKAVQNLFDFRVQSPSFTVIAPAKALIPPGQLEVPGNTDPIVSDGYWLYLSPLSAGQHEIHITAETSSGAGLDVTYKLTVE
jgi:hypothetical protein